MATGMHGDVLNELGGRIAAGNPQPGSVLKLALLEKELSASRTVIREAIRVLENMGMVASRRRVGITVQPREKWDALDPSLIRWTLHGPLRQQQLESLMELRVAVEPMAARLAAERATPAQRAELLRVAERLHDLGKRGLGQSPEYLEVDLAFHTLLLTSSANPLLVALETPVREELAGRTHLGLHPTVPAPGTLEQHLVIAQAIAAGDGDEAEAHSRAHLLGVWREIAVEPAA
ncbi:DNA-binding FadR family transcriptional regulator [Okibacterium sp. HSC-33S16]|uniref:FadR/GntR family transcriptional regulator n=1 Tax=Okibacterium sp. HSC-33S16 TaxID=2910965 RepID=UPI0020A1612B|nr:FCD domain-containing protein [Okibacterium sp. HSC-33S16]MCP2031139.1 DNA-binding FadR family transcriptional regulator [Okibacterium sp. HSC-33S16]